VRFEDLLKDTVKTMEGVMRFVMGVKSIENTEIQQRIQ
jgi:hypothetical protein